LAFAQGVNDPNQAVTPNVVAAAYTNNFLGATATGLYVISTDANGKLTLASQGSLPGVTPVVSPNLGTLFTIATITGVTAQPGTAASLDVAGDGLAQTSTTKGVAILSVTPTGATTPSLYTLNLQTGAAKLIGAIGGTTPVTRVSFSKRQPTIVG